MKKMMISTGIIISGIFMMSVDIYSWEMYDRVIATVNERPIIESEVEARLERAAKGKNIPQNNYPLEKSRVLDRYIEEALVEQTAADESIIVSDEKVDNHIKKIMESMNIKSEDDFIKHIESAEKMKFDDYREELKKSIMIHDVMSIAIGVSPPSAREAREYYEKNKSKVGYEVSIQHIFLKMNGDTYEENKRVNKEIKDLYGRISKGERFEDIARQYSQDRSSAQNGGDLGWVSLSNIARADMIYANNIYKEFVMGGSKMAIIKSNTGYHLVRYRGSRPTSFDGAKDEILRLIYQVKQAEQFQRWVFRRRLESEVIIHMQNYIKEKKEN